MNDCKLYQTLETTRLYLRALRSSDWEEISYLRSAPEVNKFVKRSSAETKEKALEFISKIENGMANQSFYYWVISEKHDDKMIGSICLWNFSEDRKTAEVGYDLDPKFQRKGIMNESMISVLNFGFSELEINIIEAHTSGKNVSSKNLLERNGFELVEGRYDEENLDNVIYQIENAKTT